MKFLSMLSLLVGMTFYLGCQSGLTAANQAATPLPPPAVNAEPAVNATPVVVGVTPFDDVPRISLADAKAAFDAGGALFVDSRAEAAYKAEHIKGAINIPGGTLDAKIKQLPKDKKIIVYCS